MYVELPIDHAQDRLRVLAGGRQLGETSYLGKFVAGKPPATTDSLADDNGAERARKRPQ